MAGALKGTGIRKVAFGHHADDVAETLFMNVVFKRRLGSFTPKVEIPEGEIIIIRPLVYLDGPLIKRLHTYFKLPAVLHICPYEDTGARQSMRRAISGIEEQLEMKDFSRMVASALENVDLSSIWMNLQDK
jgi:tRNA(Ile)-lysidine synthase TilS/MesJ